MSKFEYKSFDAHSTTDPITLSRFILNSATAENGSMVMLLQSIQLACKTIAAACQRAGIANLTGIATGQENSSGDVQKKLDVLSNDVFVNCLSFSEQCTVLGSEEVEEPIVLDSKHGKFCVVFDPLDGSSNIDANVSVGTIFGVYRADPGYHTGTVKDLLRAGDQLICSGYCMYGSASILVLTTGQGVHGFTLDPVIGEFILTHRNIRIPKKGKIYSINEGNSHKWDAPTTEWVSSCKAQKKSARYIGSMVADVHRTLLYGGIFSYPADRKGKGKLRLLYECNPMAMLLEQAGGKATTGTQRILSVVPTVLHQREPIFLGSADDVDQVLAIFAKHNNPTSKL